MSAITGDIGARELVATHAKLVYEVEMPDRAVLFDIDTPADLAAAARER
jgi:CTP:molybdopterin cytidylyltransferase MocA